MDFHSNCNGGHSVHYIIDLNVGVCKVSTQAEFHHSNCIHWEDKTAWEEIDDIAGSDTTEYATNVFPHVNHLRATYSGTSMGTLLVSVIALCRPQYSHKCQYLVMLITLLYVLLVFAMQVISVDNDIVSKEVWKAVTGCQQGSSVPYVAEYGLMVAQLVGIWIALIAMVPNRIICLHLVAARDGLSSSSSLSLSFNQELDLDDSLAKSPRATDPPPIETGWRVIYQSFAPPAPRLAFSSLSRDRDGESAPS
jgi:hypothetical protein